MTHRRHDHRIATDLDLEDALDAYELRDQEDAYIDKLRAEHARRAALEIFDYVELMGF